MGVFELPLPNVPSVQCLFVTTSRKANNNIMLTVTTCAAGHKEAPTGQMCQ